MYKKTGLLCKGKDFRKCLRLRLPQSHNQGKEKNFSVYEKSINTRMHDI